MTSLEWWELDSGNHPQMAQHFSYFSGWCLIKIQPDNLCWQPYPTRYTAWTQYIPDMCPMAVRWLIVWYVFDCFYNIHIYIYTLYIYIYTIHAFICLFSSIINPHESPGGSHAALAALEKQPPPRRPLGHWGPWPGASRLPLAMPLKEEHES